MPSTSPPANRPDPRDRAKGFSALFAAGIILGSFGVLIRWLDAEMSAAQQIGLRHAIALAFAIMLLLWRRPGTGFSGVRRPLLIAYAAAFPLSVIFFTYAVVSTKIAVAVFALYGGSLLVAQIGGSMFFGEKLTRRRASVLALCLTGLISFAAPSLDEASLNSGMALGFLAGLLDGVANFLRKYLTATVNRLALVTLQLFGGLLISIVILLVASDPISIRLSAFSWMIALIFGALVLAIAYLPLIGFRYFDLSLGTVVLSSELLFAPLFAILFFSEHPTPSEWLGGGLILLAVIVMNRPTEEKP